MRVAGEPDDLQWALTAAQDGDEMGFEALWRAHNSHLTRFLQSRAYGSGIDYEEVLADTWMSVARDVKKFTGSIGDFSGWLYTIARNRFIDATRRRDRQIKASGDIQEAFWIPSSTNTERDFEASEGVKEIITKINSLPEAQAEVLLLRVVGDRSVEETAKILKKSANTVRVLAHRGLTTLREELGGDDGR